MAELHGVSSQTGRFKTTRKGVSADYEEASACRNSSSIFSGSYSWLAIHEPNQRYRKESVITSKISSFGKAEQYEIPLIIEQLRGLSKSFVLVRNVWSRAYWRVGKVVQWLASLSMRP